MSAPSFVAKKLINKSELIDEYTFENSNSVNQVKDYLIHRDGLVRLNFSTLGSGSLSFREKYVMPGSNISNVQNAYTGSYGLIGSGWLDVNGNVVSNAADVDSMTLIPILTRQSKNILLDTVGSVSPSSVTKKIGDIYGNDLPIPTRDSTHHTFSHWKLSGLSDDTSVSVVKVNSSDTSLTSVWTFEPPALTNGTLLQKYDESGNYSFKLFKDGTWYDIPLTLSTYTGKATTYNTSNFIIRFPKEFSYNGTTYKRSDGYVLGSGRISSSEYGTGIYNVVTKTKKLSNPITHTNATIDGLFSDSLVSTPLHFVYGIPPSSMGQEYIESPFFRSGSGYIGYPLSTYDNVFLVSNDLESNIAQRAIRLKDYYGLSGSFPSRDEICRRVSSVGFSSVGPIDWDDVSVSGQDSLN